MVDVCSKKKKGKKFEKVSVNKKKRKWLFDVIPDVNQDICLRVILGITENKKQRGKER